jgi:hypothetical protein
MELHASTNSTQKLKLIGKGGQFTYAPTIAIDRNLQVLNYRHRVLPHEGKNKELITEVMVITKCLNFTV